MIELQVRKSTADATGSREYYNSLTKPIEGWEGEIRDMVLRKKLVRFDINHFEGGEKLIIKMNRCLPLFFFLLAPQNIRPAKYNFGQ